MPASAMESVYICKAEGQKSASVPPFWRSDHAWRLHLAFVNRPGALYSVAWLPSPIRAAFGRSVHR